MHLLSTSNNVLLRPFIFLLSTVFITTACENQEKKEERLARVYCASCHLFPEPALLDKQTWENSVLPQMAFRMGFPSFAASSQIAEQDLKTVMSTLPPQQMVSDEEWESIKNYYIRNAPEKLTLDTETITDTLHQFRPILKKSNDLSMVTLLSITDDGHLYCGTRSSRLYKLNSSLSIVDSFPITSPPADIIQYAQSIDVLTMGIMDPNDQAKGQLTNISVDKTISTLIDSIKRPVHVVRADMNGDDTDEYIVCEFGNYTGQLAIYELHDTKTIQHVLSPSPGARRTIVRDFNNDGLNDILTLFTQGDERVVLFTNKGRMHFDQRIMLRFPPVFGTSYVEVEDFNNDGYYDLAVTHGNNSDFSVIVKPYHCVSVYLNDKKNNFYKAWTFSMPGASIVHAHDYDQDGDVDLAAIAFFPDFKNQPNQNFIYFENTGAGQFTPRITSVSTVGRWLVMESGDLDRDGDLDILLGAMNFPGFGATPEIANEWQKQHIPILLLENTLH